MKLERAIKVFETARDLLHEIRMEEFPVGCVVKRGGVMGIVDQACESDPLRVGVYVQSENTWWYPIAELRKVDRKNWEPWIAREFRKRSRIRK